MTAGGRSRTVPSAPAPDESGAARAEDPAARDEAIDLGMLPALIGFGLRRAQVAVFQHFNRKLADAGISPPQFGTLVLIEANPGVSQSAVAAALRFDRSTLVQIVDRLESRGLVVRAASARDRRSHALELTPKGAKLLAELKRQVQAHEDEIAAGLSPSDRATLLDLLARVRQRAGA
jgi:DNA-binding MarR family transcriptional regulator